MNNDYPGLKSKHNQAAAIVDQLTRAEKAKLCSGKSFWYLESIERLNLPAVMVTDGPHGLRKQDSGADHVGLNQSVPATCFPTACALAASWDIELLHEVGVALGEQCVAEQVTVLLGPGVNIKRHPYCGRNFEYFSEDPYITGKLATALIQGVQSQGIGTSIKHFAVNNQENGRMIVDAIVDERSLREIYLRGFEMAIKAAQPWTVMCAYNRINGTYCSENDWLLNQVLRHEWGFEGLVVTDWGATNDRVAGVESGLDLEMPSSGGLNDKLVEAALENGSLDEAILDKSISRNIALSLLGQDLHEKINLADKGSTGAELTYEIDQQEHHLLARRAATESIVLLKNEDDILPLKEGRSYAVIGEFAKRPRYQGAGSSQVNPTELENAWQAITEYSDALLYAPGYDAKTSEEDEALIQDAVNAAKQAETAIIFAGLPSIYESEGFDRTHLNLPAQHSRLIHAVSSANPNTIVVLLNGAPVAMPWLDSPRAVLEAYLPGQAGGTAIADILFGAQNPCGKLAETFPWSATDVAANKWFPGKHRQVQYREGLNVGYRYFDSAEVPVLFPFGHGLSYTSFEYSNLEHAEFTQGESLNISFDLKNVGERQGAEIVQCYITAKNATVYKPEQELKAFTKVRLESGEQQRIQLQLNDDAFSFYDIGSKQWVVEPGEYEIRIAASSRDIRLQANIQVSSEQTASSIAQQSMPPEMPSAGFDVANDQFDLMLNKTCPPPETSRPYHLNSSVGELRESWLGSKVRKRIIENFMKNMGANNSDATLSKMFEEMADNMPLRGMALFSRGKLDFLQLNMLIAALNGKPIEAARIWVASRVAQSDQQRASKKN